MNALRWVRAQPPALFSSSLQSSLGNKSSVISLRPVASSSSREKPENPENMDQKEENPKEKSGDVMSHSFGEGYATRSEEEGFGGIYGRDDESITDTKSNKKIHEDHPAYDKSQGSEVKEKEKARHQT
ncbi:hypothetical protein DITRI_Ditri16bG0021600 [Diplodiscus trichospermus]